MYIGTDIDVVNDPFTVSAEREARRRLTPLPLTPGCHIERQAVSLLTMAQSAAAAVKPELELRLREVKRLRHEAVKLVGEETVLALIEEHRLCLQVQHHCSGEEGRPARFGFVRV